MTAIDDLYEEAIQGNYGKPEYGLPSDIPRCKMCNLTITLGRHLCDQCYELKLDEEMRNEHKKTI